MVRSAGSSPIKEPCELTLCQLRKLPDEEVMRHLQGGHDDALAVLFDRYHGLILAIATRIVRDRGEAEDVLQTVFLEIFRAAAQFDAAKGSVKVWLLQYAYHRSINRRRLTNRSPYPLGGLEEVCNCERANPPNGRHAFPVQESSVLVREALKTLNKAQKTALELAYFEGLTMKEIAEKTGETLPNVRHHFYRGLDNLRLYLGIEVKKVCVSREEVVRAES